MKSFILALVLSFSMNSAFADSSCFVQLIESMDSLPSPIKIFLKQCYLDELEEGQDVLNHAFNNGCLSTGEYLLIKETYAIERLDYFSCPIEKKTGCLDINNFADLQRLTTFDDREEHWPSLSNLIQGPEGLTPLHHERLFKAEGMGGISFMLATGFDGEGLYWESFQVKSTGRSYDIYLYEAGDNGAGFIFESGDSTKVVANISDGVGGDITGCIKR